MEKTREYGEEFLEVLFSTAQVIILALDTKGRIIRFNPYLEEISGYCLKEVVGKDWFTTFLPKRNQDQTRSLFSKAVHDIQTRGNIDIIVTKDGRELLIEWYDKTLKEADGEVIGLISIGQDVTGREKIAGQMARLNRMYATLSDVNQAIVHIRERDELFREICRIVVEQGKFRMAWIGLIDPKTKYLVPAFVAGEAKDYLTRTRVSAEEKPEGQRPAGKAIRLGKCQVCDDVLAEPEFLPWREETLKVGFRSMASVPISFQGSIIGAFSLYAAEPGFFGKEEVKLLEEVGVDISFALDNIEKEKRRTQAEKEIRDGYQKLKIIVDGTVNALALTIEMRDPYTSGHQARVTKLVCAIAEEMGLLPDQIDAIRVAGLIHDIGKINIPSEILGKPGKLSDSEMNLIRIHSQSGYDIVKTIPFVFPVAQIVLQHHERLDGSGYPGGLSEEEIMLEARIIAVADTVEAMASDRPYRAAVGIEKALAEISKNKGILYDAAVVDACLKVFEQNFSFT